MVYTSKNIYQNQLNDIVEKGLYKNEWKITSSQSAQIKVLEDSNVEKDILNLCANNYLGLSNNEEIIEAAKNSLTEKGFGMSSVRFICGTQDIHKELEFKLSLFLEKEDTILFASAFDANTALFEAILTEEDELFSDKLVHASLIDGMRLCKAKKQIYNHSDMADLEKKLSESTARIKMIVTDGVFSMDGDMAKLDEISLLSEKYNAMLVVDDCHATGFIGESGKGTHEYFNVKDKVDIITTTFGKALGGSMGGSISGPKEVIEILRQKARPYLFSNALMPAIVSGTLKALELVENANEERKQLIAMSDYWKNGLVSLGFDVKEGSTPIIPIMLYESKVTQEFSKRLFENGVYAVGFFYPVVAEGEARIRTQISALHTKDQLEQALRIFQKVKSELGV
ncbi:MAG: glycine C-acetyltransferase [Candidatus Actinomarina sp.]|nr:glycine C-acetyltransferase [Candidatus Actinomarina sp.]MDG1229424.1 glycine C-acetyltransferase [Candidatus Actinomarina sp.]MDG1740916.1 glycine C-acetyltransferase [Candidatus Actinomarina sp.]MDG2082462.1 glycine C-acetyltransferase [Candidatus Actinomarina sp.]